MADGRWVRQAFTSQFAEFEDPGSSARDLGSDFTQKMFDHVVLIPDLSSEQISTYLDDVVGAQKNNATGRPEVSSDRRTLPTVADNADPQEGRARSDAAQPAHESERMQIDRVRQDATPVATEVRSYHLLHSYADLMPANPRMIKRVSNALGMLQAIRMHVQHTEDDDAMARAAILFVRFPSLAARLRFDDLINSNDSCWHLPGVRSVLGACSLESLARCLGRAVPPGANES